MAKGETASFEDCQLRAVGKAAILVAHEDWEEPVWFPNSHIDDDSELYMKSEPGDTGKLVVTAWIAEQKGLL
jgi:hypothetical protein